MSGMLNIEPQALVFRNVMLNQTYTTRQSIVITVRLLISHYPNISMGFKGVVERIHIKSLYFEQNIEVTFFLDTGNKSALEGRPPIDSATGGARSRSVSPGLHMRDRNSPSSASGAMDTFADLRTQLHMKDEKIALLQSNLEQLQLPYPDFQQIIEKNVEHERVEFEKKSEKALKILQAKDEVISGLRSKLAAQEAQFASVMQNPPSAGQMEANASGVGHASPGLGLSKLDYSQFAKAAAQKERIGSLEQALSEARNRFKDEQRTHGLAKSNLVEMEGKMSRLEHSSSHEVSVLKNELGALRERSADQLEQIQVLVQEVSKLRTDRHEAVLAAQQNAQQDISRVQSEVARHQKTVKDLEYQNAVLQRTIESNAKLIQGEADASAKLLNENQRLNERMKQLLKDKDSLDQVRIEKEFLLQQLEDTRNAEKDLRTRVREAHDMVRSHEDECVAARKEALEARLARDDLQAAFDVKQVQLSSAEEKSGVADSRGKMVNAHVWWAYIWHELSENKKKTDLVVKHNRNKIPAAGPGRRFSSADNKENRGNLLIGDGRVNHSQYGAQTNYSVSHDGEHHGEVLVYLDDNAEPVPVNEVLLLVTSLKEMVRTQSVEIAKLRQEHLKGELAGNREGAQAREDFKKAHLENIRLGALLRRQADEKEAKISEMAQTIRDLSQKSDIHKQFAHVRSDLETERLLNFSLRADVDSYREMHKSEQESAEALRAEMAALRSTLDTVAVLKTVMDVPGVDPASLLECICDKLVQSEEEVSKLRTALAMAQTQVQSLQRLKGVTQRVRSVGDGAENMFNVLNTPVGTEHAEGDLAAPDVNVGSSASTENPVDGAFLSRHADVAEGHFTVLIDGDATPQKLLECLDSVLLAQQIKIKEDHIAELQQLNARLANDVLTAEQSNNKILGEGVDSFDKRYRIELENSLRQQQLLEVGAEDSRKEASKLRTQLTSMQKELSTLQAQLTMASQPTHQKEPGDYFLSEDSQSPSASLDVDELHQENSRLRSQLDDRTLQLRAAGETLELLEDGASSGSSTREKGLIVRIISLTSELNTQTELIGKEKQRSAQLDHAYRQRQRDVNKLRAHMKQNEDEHSSLHLQLATVNERLRDAEHGRIEDKDAHEAQIKEMELALKQAESQTASYSIAVEEMKSQAMLFEDDSIESWLQIILAGQEESDSTSPFIAGLHHLHESDSDILIEDASEANASDGAEEVTNLVMSLLEEWRNATSGSFRTGDAGAASFIPYNSGNIGTSASQSHSPIAIARLNQQFMQRVSDLVLQASKSNKDASNARNRADRLRASATLTARVSTDRLRSCLLYLNRCRRRIFALERLVGADMRAHVIQHEKRVSLLRSRLDDEMDAHANARRALVDSRRSARLADLRRKFETRRVAALQARVGELEGRGGAVLRGKQEATAVFEERISGAEENLQRWFNTQLPLLLAERLPQGLDMQDRNEATFALAQALCSEKAAVTKLQLQAQVEAEKNFLQAEQLGELRGALLKWRAEVSAGSHASGDGAEKDVDVAGNPANVAVSDGAGGLIVVGLADQHMDAVMHTAAETESQLATRIADLSNSHLGLEESILEAKTRSESLVSQNSELKILVEHLLGEERTFKTAAAKKMAHLQLRYERVSSIEFRKMKRLYDDDKTALRAELERVLSLVDFARASMLEQAKKHDKDMEAALESFADAEAKAKAAVSLATVRSATEEKDEGNAVTNGTEEAVSRAKTDMEKAVAAFTRAMDVQKDILSQRNGAGLLATILESPSKSRQSGSGGRFALSTAGNQIVDEQGTPLVFPDLSDVVAGRIRMLLNRLASGPDLEAKLKAMHVYTGSKNPDFTVGGFEEESQSSDGSSENESASAAKDLELDILKLQRTLEEERVKNEQAHRDFLAKEKALHDRVSAAPVVHQQQGAADHSHRVPHYMQPTVAALRHGAHVNEHNAHLHDVASLETQHGHYADTHNPHHPHHTGQGYHASEVTSHAAHDHSHSAGSRVHTGSEHSEHHPRRNAVDLAAQEAELQKREAARERIAQEKHDAQVAVLERLQHKMQEMEHASSREMESARSAWEEEKRHLHSKHAEHKHGHDSMLNELRAANEAQTTSLRERYEEALRQAQEALEQQSAAAADQLTRLETSLSRVQRQLEHESAGGTQGKQIIAQLESQISSMQRDMEEALAGILELRELSNRHELRASNLEEALQAANASLAEKEAELAKIEAPNFDIAAPTPAAPPTYSADVAALAQAQAQARRPRQVSEEFVGIQILLERTTDELENVRSALRDSESRYSKDIHILREQCQILGRERNDLQSALAASASHEFSHGSLEAEEAVRRLEYQYKCKVVELETVLRGLGEDYAPATQDQITPKVPLAMQSELLRLRLVAAEEEIDTLQQLLSRQRAERRELNKELAAARQGHASAQADVSAMDTNTSGIGSRGRKEGIRERVGNVKPGLSAGASASNSPGRSRLLSPTRASVGRQAVASPYRTGFGEARDMIAPRPTSRSPSLGRRLRNLNANAAESVSILSTDVENVRSAQPTSSDFQVLKANRAEVSSLREQLDDATRNLASLKEDLRRKAKLFLACKTAKASEEAAAEQWKNEAQASEENVRRLTRALANKESLIKDLRAKVDEQQRREVELNETKESQVAPNAALSGDLLGLSHSELRSKLRVSETERLKIRSRLHNLHDRLVETQTECQKLREQLEVVTKDEERVENLRYQLARREAQVRSLKLQLQSVRDESDKALAEADRNNQGVKAQYDALRTSFHEIVRKEASAAHEHSSASASASASSTPAKKAAAASKAESVDQAGGRYVKSTKSSDSKVKPLVGVAKERAVNQKQKEATVQSKQRQQQVRRAPVDEEEEESESESDETSDDEAPRSQALPATLGSATNADLADILAQLALKL